MAELAVLGGRLSLRSFRLGEAAAKGLRKPAVLEAGTTLRLDCLSGK